MLRRQKDVLRRYVPTVGLINRSLFPTQLSQLCCHSSEINLLTHGKKSEAAESEAHKEAEKMINVRNKEAMQDESVTRVL